MSGRIQPMAIFLLALVLRLLYLSEAGDSPFFEALGLDAKYYDDEALRIQSGTQPAEPFFMGPLYSYFLALVYSVAGHSFGVVRVLQALMGAVTTVAVWGIAARLAGRTTALVAGLLVAIYPTLIFYSGSILYPTLAALLDTAAVWLLIRHEQTGRPRDLVFAGLVLGASAVGQATVLSTVPAILVWLWFLSGRAFGPAVRRAAPFLLALAIPILPVTARNVMVSGEPILLTSNAGLNFYIGNGPEATGGYVKPRGLDVYEDPSGRRMLTRRLERPLTARETDRVWMRGGIDAVVENPGRFLSLMLRKVFLYWGAVEIPQIESFEFQKNDSPTVRRLDALPISFGLLGPLAGLGAFLLLTDARRRAGLGRRLAPPVIFVVFYSMTFLLFFVISRYRLPMVPLLLIFSAAALIRMASGARAGFAGLISRRTVVAALVLIASSLVVNGNPYQVSRTSGFGQCHYRLGIIARQEGRVDDAEAEYRAALSYEPDYAPTHLNLAEVLLARGERADALAATREAVRLDPEYGRARYNLGILLARGGDWREAGPHFESARRLAPGLPDSWFGVGAFRFHVGDRIGARTAFQRMAERAAAAGADAIAARGAALVALVDREEQMEQAAGPGDETARGVARTAAFWVTAGERAHGETVMRSTGPVEDPLYLFHRGDILIGAGRLEPGEEAVRRALSLAPGLPFAHFSLGAARIRAGDHDGAAIAFQREVEANPGNGSAHFNLGIIELEYRRNPAAAAAHFQRCAAIGRDRAAEARDILRRIGAA